MSSDGASSIVVIAMLGNPFSPRWARARARARETATEAPTWQDFCALNVSVRHAGRSAWALTEHRRESVARGPDHITLGRSEIAWNRGRLELRIDERTAPWAARLRGTVRLTPLSAPGPVVALDREGAYVWRANAPFAGVEVDFEDPGVAFRGVGYLDANQADGPLEDAFSSWTWSRVSDAQSASIAYDVVLRDGSTHRRGIALEKSGRVRPERSIARAALPSSLFGLPRSMRCEDPDATAVVTTIEDGPFYARTVVQTPLRGHRATGMHEVVSLDRFRSRWVQTLLPYRMRVEGA